MSIAAVRAHSAASLQPAAASVPMARREAWIDLRRALRADDLSAAAQAYASIVKHVPEGATLPLGSAFAALGEALVEGDGAAAKEAFRTLQLARLTGASSGPAAPLPLRPANGAGGIDLYAWSVRRYKPVERNGLFIPVVLEEQIQPGTFEFALGRGA